jgi:hypothetical protein
VSGFPSTPDRCPGTPRAGWCWPWGRPPGTPTLWPPRRRPARRPDWVDQRFLRIGTEALLTHEEHAPIQLPAGLYRVVRQREYLPGWQQREYLPGWQQRDVAD